MDCGRGDEPDWDPEVVAAVNPSMGLPGWRQLPVEVPGCDCGGACGRKGLDGPGTVDFPATPNEALFVGAALSATPSWGKSARPSECNDRAADINADSPDTANEGYSFVDSFIRIRCPDIDVTIGADSSNDVDCIGGLKPGWAWLCLFASQGAAQAAAQRVCDDAAALTQNLFNLGQVMTLSNVRTTCSGSVSNVQRVDCNSYTGTCTIDCEGYTA